LLEVDFPQCKTYSRDRRVYRGDLKKLSPVGIDVLALQETRAMSTRTVTWKEVAEEAAAHTGCDDYELHLIEALPTTATATGIAARQAGVGFLVRRALNATIREGTATGRTASCLVRTTDGRAFTVLNVYAPLSGSPEAVSFWETMPSRGVDAVVGDFNVDFNVDIPPTSTDTPTTSTVDPPSTRLPYYKADHMAAVRAWMTRARLSDVAKRRRCASWTWAGRVVSLPTRRRLDYIFVRPATSVPRTCRLVRHAHHDHLMIVATLSLTRASFAQRTRRDTGKRLATTPPIVAHGGTRKSTETHADQLQEQLAASVSHFNELVPDEPPARPPQRNKYLLAEDTVAAIRASHSAYRKRRLEECAGPRHDYADHGVDLGAARRRISDRMAEARAARRRASLLVRRDKRRAWDKWLKTLNDMRPQDATRAIVNATKPRAPLVDPKILAQLPTYFKELLDVPYSTSDSSIVANMVSLVTTAPSAKILPQAPSPISIFVDAAAKGNHRPTDNDDDSPPATHHVTGGAGLHSSDPHMFPDMSFKVMIPPGTAGAHNFAEFAILAHAMETAAVGLQQSPMAVTVNFYTDSQRAANAACTLHRLRGVHYPITHGQLIRRMHNAEYALTQAGHTVCVSHIPREDNTTAHNLARMGHKSPITLPPPPPLPEVPYTGVPDHVPSPQEVADVVFATYGRKAVGPDGIGAHVLRAAYRVVYRPETLSPAPTEQTRTAAKAVVDCLDALIAYVFTHGYVPRAWLRATIVPIPKTRTPKVPAEFRGISLISHVAKVASAIIGSRAAVAPLATWQCGFRPGRSTTHAIIACQSLYQLHVKRGVPLHAIYIDCTKAFDTVHRERMLLALEKCGVGPRLRAVIKACLSEDEIGLRTKPGEPEPEFFSSTAGVRQGDNMSPVLFVMVLDAVVRAAGLTPYAVQLKDRTFDFSALGYADDLALFHEDPAILQANMDKLVVALDAFGLKINIKKTHVMSAGHLKELMRHSSTTMDAKVKPLPDGAEQPPRVHYIKYTDQVHRLLFNPADGPRVRCPVANCQHWYSNDAEGARPLAAHVIRVHGIKARQIGSKRCDQCQTMLIGRQYDSHAQHCAAGHVHFHTRPCPRCKYWFSKTNMGRHLCASNAPLQCLITRPVTNEPTHQRRIDATPVQHCNITITYDGVATPVTPAPGNNFKYLGRTVTPFGDSSADFQRKLRLAYAKVTPVAEYLREAVIPRNVKLALLEQQALSVLFYASETWTLTEGERNKLRTFQVRMLRRMLGIHMIVHTDNQGVKKFTQIPNIEVMDRAKATDIVLTWLKRKATFAHACASHDISLPERAIFEIAAAEKTERATCKIPVWVNENRPYHPQQRKQNKRD